MSKQRLQFATHVGMMEIVSFAEFVSKYMIYTVLSPEVDTAHWYSAPAKSYASINAFPERSEAGSGRNQKELERIAAIDIPPFDRGRFQKELDMQLHQALNEFVAAEMRKLILKREPEFYVKDLNTTAITDLAGEYANKTGGSELVGFHYILSKYQQYFVIVNPESFNLQYKVLQLASFGKPNPQFGVFGAFIELAPHKWALGRYDEMGYLLELNRNARVT